jgi:gliding motility-associated protein GldL
MNISELVETTGWKKFMGKIYGWGATVVLIGALFKIQHWPGAGIMLTIGLCTEALIFFFSAFEPLHEELDWTLVYPELAGMTEDDEVESYKEGVIGNRSNLERFDALVGGAEISEEAIDRVGEGLSKLGTAASKISDITESTVAAQQYSENLKNAAQTFDKITDSYSSSTETLHTAMGALSGSYVKVAGIVEQSGQHVADQLNNSSSILSDNYKKLTESISGYYNSISEGGKNYGQRLDQLTLNLDQLNALYELQLKGTQENLKNTEHLYGGMEEMLKNLQSSVDETMLYREEIAKLSQNLASLNAIYGNMLSAMNASKR